MSALPWFRMYNEFIHDEMIEMLAFEDQRHYVFLLCMKNMGSLDKNYPAKGMIDQVISRRLGIFGEALTSAKKRLMDVGLIDGEWQPTGWDKRQFVSDSSSERVKRHRAKRAEQGLPQQNFIKPSVRAAVFENDGNACVYCGDVDDLTIDHKIPQSRGGTDDPENLATACRSCNASKRDLTHDEFLARKEGNVTVTPYIQNQIPEAEADKTSVPKGTGVKPPMTPTEIAYCYGLPLLTNAGVPERQARSFLGKMLAQDADQLVEVLRECIRVKPLQPLEWIAKAMLPKSKMNKQEQLENRNRRTADEWVQSGEVHA